MAETRSNFSVIPKSQFSKIFNPIDESISSTQPMSQIKTPMPINQNPVIRSAGMFLEPQTTSLLSQEPMPPPQPEQDDSSNFLGSLIAQGVAGIGTGLMGGSASDIQRSAGMFDSMRSQQASRDRAKLLMDPKSKESEARRKAYKAVGLDVPENLSYTDLNDPTVLQTLKGQMEERKLASMPRQGGGVGGVGKLEKEIKSNQKSLADYKEHVSNVAEMSNVIDTIKKLNRTRIGGITPDFNLDTQAYSTSLDRAAQPMIKTLAGPGTLQKEERDTYGKLVPTGNTRSDLALRQANDIILDGTKISLGKMNTDLSIGNLNRKDYDTLINQYNEQLTKKGIGVNQVINPETGQLVSREKNESELKDGRKVLIDQFGYTWE